jgi:hypothetical protein
MFGHIFAYGVKIFGYNGYMTLYTPLMLIVVAVAGIIFGLMIAYAICDIKKGIAEDEAQELEHEKMNKQIKDLITENNNLKNLIR